ncbi:hypothetical protein JCM33374_g1398 [Metschnikowia sp. JCM 33374]|nr:hypothetical protein JCM33374_g1398 [Metschnikowia sp. JCM 33374]
MKTKIISAGTAFAWFFWVSSTVGLSLNVNSKSSICAAAYQIVDGELDYYEGIRYGGTVGMFTWPYYWWHAGEVFGGWVDYWAFCAKNNDTFSGILFDAMYSQRGANNNYMPQNQTVTEGNDDQGVWGMTLMQAVERNFTNPKQHTWLYLTQSLFNTMNSRWNTTTCNGGLKWQIFTYLNGFYYKNTISNGSLFQLAARLYRFTGNKYYLDVAEKVWTWALGIGLINTEKNTWEIYDGATESTNCTELTKWKWSYTYGIFMSGSAYLYNATGDPKWRDATLHFVNASSYFFNNTVMTEMTCATVDKCNEDESAKAAARSCSGDETNTCGFNWSEDGWDGVWGLGEQMSALETIMSLITYKQVPLTPKTGAQNRGGNVKAGINTSAG